MGDTLSFAEQDALYKKTQAKYLAKLQARLADGTITEQFYQNELQRTRDNLSDPSDGEWSAFLSDVGDEAAKLPKKVQTAIVDTAGYVAETAGKTAGATAGGLSKGIFTGLGVSGWVMAVLIVAVLVWAFWKGPLRGAKIKAIPVPV